jgi:hypothetical protein
MNGVNFFSRVQCKGEPIEQFIADLYKMAERCDFANLKDSLIMHKLIQGMIDKQR